MTPSLAIDRPGPAVRHPAARAGNAAPEVRRRFAWAPPQELLPAVRPPDPLGTPHVAAPRARAAESRGVSELEDGCFHADAHKTFRDGYGDLYRVAYRREADGTFALLSTERPPDPYGGSVEDTHVYSSGKICVSGGREPRSLDQAVAVSKVWIDSYGHWIRTGERGRTGGRVDV